MPPSFHLNPDDEVLFTGGQNPAGMFRDILDSTLKGVLP